MANTRHFKETILTAADAAATDATNHFLYYAEETVDDLTLRMVTGPGLTENDTNYVVQGRREAQSFLDFARRHGISGGRILDFGCSSGRILRHFGDHSEFTEIYGVDVDTVNVNWALEHLPERFKLITEGADDPQAGNHHTMLHALGTELFQF